MCAVLPHNLGKGPRWRVPVASLRPMTRLQGIEPHRVIRPYRRSITRQSWSFPAPPAPNHGGPLWPVQRHSVEPPSSPRPHGQPSAGWMPPAFRRWSPRREISLKFGTADSGHRHLVLFERTSFLDSEPHRVCNDRSHCPENQRCRMGSAYCFRTLNLLLCELC
jgi:hypothetical protein